MRQERRTFHRCGTCAYGQSVAETNERTIGEIISDALVEKGYTVRGLARDIAGPSAEHREVERIRRRLYRYLDDSIPDEEMAAELSRRLGVKAAVLTRPATERAGRGRLQKIEHRLAALEDEVARVAEEAARGFEELARQLRESDERRGRG